MLLQTFYSMEYILVLVLVVLLHPPFLVYY
jgi:hypothetical protein